MSNTKYEPHFYGPLQGVVIGDGNTITIIYSSGVQSTVPFLAPPRNFSELVGRGSLLQSMKERLISGDNNASCAAIGLPGVGKTALAVELVHDHDVLTRFCDGVLWAGLGRQANVLAVLGTWGIALGIASEGLAKLTDIGERARAIHVAFGMRRMLLVIDDAWQLELALTLRLGGPNCAYILTTRFPEIALRFAGEGLVTVHELDQENGFSLLARLAPEAVKAEPDEARALVRTVGGLPLALTLMGHYLRIQSYSGQPRRLRAALDRLHKVEERLRIQQPQSPLERQPSLPTHAKLSLLASIRISEQALNRKGRVMLSALSVFPPKPNNFSEEAALAIADEPAEILDVLTDFGLLESSGPGRYTLHQTITDYLRQKPIDKSVYARMVDYFVQHVETHQTNLGAIDQDLVNVIAALEDAFEHKIYSSHVRGVKFLHHYLEVRGLYTVAETLLYHARQAARTLNDIDSEATVLLHLGDVTREHGNLDQAEAFFQEGVNLARQSGRQELISSLLNGLGWVAGMRGDYSQAETNFRDGLILARISRSQEHICALLQGLGWVANMLGEHEQAKIYFQESLALARDTALGSKVVDLLESLGWVTAMSSDLVNAQTYFQECLTLARSIGYRERIIQPLQGLGWIFATRGDYVKAETYFQEGFALAQELGHHERMSLLANLGWVARERGNYEQANQYLQEGLRLAQEFGHREKTSLLLTNLGQLEYRRGNFARAESYLHDGLDVAREIGHHERMMDPLNNLGAIARRQNDYKQAEAYLLEGLALAQDIENQWFISTFLIENAELYLDQADFALASQKFNEALTAAQKIESQDLIATALYGLGRSELCQGNISEARQRGTESLEKFEILGHEKTLEVKHWLAKLPLPELTE